MIRVDEFKMEDLQDYIIQFKAGEGRLRKLKDYYMGNTAIMERQLSEGKPNNKIATPFASYITDSIAGYFLGRPVQYRSANEDLLTRYTAVMLDNLEEGHNLNLAKDLSIYGVAFELLYLDKEGSIKLAQLSPLNTFMVYDNSIIGKPLAAVRLSGEEVEVYTKEQVIKVDSEGKVKAREDHYFGKVPVIYYHNNSELQGDFEKVMGLIDAYELSVSDTVNDLAYLSDAILAIYDGTLDPEADMSNLRQNRVMLLNDGAKAEFLTKNVSDAQAENLKERVRQDIFHLTTVPDMTSIGGQGISGEAMKYRLINLDNKIALKERLFAKSLQVRVEAVVNVLNIKGGNYKPGELNFIFNRNLPQNLNYELELAQKLAGVVSQRTLLEQLSFIKDVDSELERIEGEGGIY